MIILSLGSNIGNKEKNLRKARELLVKSNVLITNYSSLYRTEPIGYKDQDDFYNQILQVTTEYSPLELLKVINRIETKLGRKRLFKNSPRTIDIDIICYHDKIMKTDKLTIPHPEYKNRKFVLKPLIEIIPNFQDPESKDIITNLINKCTDTTQIEKIKDKKNNPSLAVQNYF